MKRGDSEPCEIIVLDDDHHELFLLKNGNMQPIEYSCVEIFCLLGRRCTGRSGNDNDKSRKTQLPFIFAPLNHLHLKSEIYIKNTYCGGINKRGTCLTSC